MLIPAVILAGDGRSSKQVRSTSKAFLSLRGRPLLAHVLSTLLRTPEVGRIVCVGSKDRIQDMLSQFFSGEKSRITVLEQERDILSNILLGYHAIFPDSSSGDGEGVALFVPCDIPLLIPQELSNFLNSADLDNFDYVVGLSTEKTLSPYYPGPDVPGIQMSYFHFREGCLRQNNLHVGRPLAASHLKYVRILYDFRYQKKWVNFFPIILAILSLRRSVFPVLFLYFRLWTALRLDERNLRDTFRYRCMVRRNSLEEATVRLGKILGLRVGVVKTRHGGGALDVDNEKTLATAEEMWDAWMLHQRKLINED